MLEQYSASYGTDTKIKASLLTRLAYTLATRRSVMSWRSCAVVTPGTPLETANLATVKSLRSSNDKILAFVFTGQGAQYARMGLALQRYPLFRSALARADSVLRSIGAEWSLEGKPDHNARATSRY
jgi:acyl transferase domain-containing protein